MPDGINKDLLKNLKRILIQKFFMIILQEEDMPLMRQYIK
jgi:hypothetical protein